MTRAFQFRLPFDTSRVIIDTPAGAPNSEVRKLLRLADVVVVPVLPSAIDMRAVTDFLAKLEREREHRPIALVANRLRVNTLGSSKLCEFLSALRIPVVAQLHDLQIYAHCAESGRGLHDMEAREVVRERDALRQLADWIDTAGQSAVCPPPPENLALALPDAV